MGGPATADEFVTDVRRSGVAGDRLAAFLAHAVLPPSPDAVAARMVEEGLLTQFQATQLLGGKWRGFIVAGKYRLLEPVGAGGMGQVFVCEHLRMGSLVALKMLAAERVGGPATVERFEREARAAAALNHPNLVRAFDVDEADGIHFLVMEYVHGASLQKLGKLPPNRAIEYARQAALGLAHAHAAGLVHRDVKPGNLLVDAAGTVKVLDLGLARFAADHRDKLTDEQNREAILGTADYLSPEQAVDSTAVDARADLYSLGCTLFFLLTGTPPFAGGTVAETLIRHQTRPLPALDVPGLPDGFEEFLRRMAAKNPADRPASASAVAETLGQWVHEAVPAPAAGDLPALCPAVRRLMPSAGPPSGRAIPQSQIRPPRASGGRTEGRFRPLAWGVALASLAVGGFALWSAWPTGTPSEARPPDRGSLPNPFEGIDPDRTIDSDTAYGLLGQRRTVRINVRGRERDPKTGALRLYSRSKPTDAKTFTVVIRPEVVLLLGAGDRDPFDYLFETKLEVTGVIADLNNVPGRPGIEVTSADQIRRVPAGE